MLTNFELPPKKFELGDKVRNIIIDESENRGYETQSYIIDGLVVGYQYQDKLWLKSESTLLLTDLVYLQRWGWVYAVVWEQDGSIKFSHFLEDKLNKIDSLEPETILNFSVLKGKLSFTDVS
jgi:hypothetical protein